MFVVHAIHLPASLRSTGVAPLPRYYGHSEFCHGTALGLASMNTVSGPQQTSLLHGTKPSRRSVSIHPSLSPATGPAFFTGSYRASFLASPLGPERLGLHLSVAGSPQRQAESSSSAYRPAVRLGLLPTPSRGDAVTFDYRGQVLPRVRTFTSPIRCAHRRTTASYPNSQGSARPIHPVYIRTACACSRDVV